MSLEVDVVRDDVVNELVGLIRSDRVHGSLYTRPDLFAEELRRIWYRTWVFVGHESEVPQPNDYVRRWVGPQDVILVRDAEGKVRVLRNRCPHRGSQICQDPCGNASTLRCAYHGWTFRTDGSSAGVAFPKGYGPDVDPTTHDLAQFPRVESYRGFVFASGADDGPSLAEHLGAAAGTIDRLLRISPVEEVRVPRRWVRHEMAANWKLLVENETDGYHPAFVHGSVFRASTSGLGALYRDNSGARTRYLGNGHTENDLRPTYRERQQPLEWVGSSPERAPRYVAAMKAALGAHADEVLVEGAPHVMIFPNLFIGEVHLTMFQPVRHDLTIQHSTSLEFVGGEELNPRSLHQSTGSLGPAGLLLADDAEMHERAYRGLLAHEPEWVDLSRGMHRETLDEEGFVAGFVSDETSMRGFWSHYRDLITEESRGRDNY
ncbi:MAG TPA: Rieske 2Fe-2S domain-containing protein [Ilumatobacter sp.]|nr:Rieske 2Fe-2S domain-containing protein [Ilumatobacter sp.]